MHMVHLSGNTSVVSKSSSDWLNYTGFPETCVSRSLMYRLETKMPWCQTPSRKKKAIVFINVTANAYQGQLNVGFSKVCEIFKVRSIESFKYIREFHALLFWWHFHAPKRDAERNKLWLVVWHVGQTASWAGLGQWMRPSIPDLQSVSQPSVWPGVTGRQRKCYVSGQSAGHTFCNTCVRQ